MSPRPRRRAPWLGVALLLAAASPARAQFWTQKGTAPAAPSGVTPKILEDVRVDEQLGAVLPADLAFTDWNGRPVRLGSLFGRGRPVVLALVYYECPMLCGLVQSGMARAMRESGLVPGKDFTAASISFDPRERPALARERRRGYLQSLGLDESSDAWAFWVDRDGDARRLADAVGFHYAQDPVSGEWAHLAAIYVLTPDGKVSRYLYGVEFPPKDLRLAIVEAGGGRIGTSFDRLILTCYRYDPATRRYLPFAFGLLRLGGGLVLLALGLLVAALVWRERRRARLARTAP